MAKPISEDKRNMILNGNLFHAILMLAIPVMINSFIQSMYNLTDTFWLGRIGTENQSAITLVSPFQNILINFGNGITTAGAILISQYLGAREDEQANSMANHICLTSLAFSVLCALICWLVSPGLVKWLGAEGSIYKYGLTYIRIVVLDLPFLFTINLFTSVKQSQGDTVKPMLLNMFGVVINLILDPLFLMVFKWGIAGAALATLIAQGISAVFSLLIFFSRMRRYKSRFEWFDRHELHSMLRIAVPSVLQQSTVSIGMMIVQAVVNPFGTQALAGYSATMRVENVFSLIFVSIGNAVSPFVSQNLGAKKTERIKKGYHAALVLDLCFAVLAFIVIETLHTQISSLFLGKDGTALAYQVSRDYMRWLGFFFIFMGIKMATDGVLRGLGIMRPFLAANMVNLAIRLSVALICAPRFGIAFVWLAVPVGWLANFLISYVALRKSWPAE